MLAVEAGLTPLDHEWISKRLVAPTIILPWDGGTGLKWAELLARLRATGKAMPIKDSLIAPTAGVHGLGGRHAKALSIPSLAEGWQRCN